MTDMPWIDEILDYAIALAKREVLNQGDELALSEDEIALWAHGWTRGFGHGLLGGMVAEKSEKAEITVEMMRREARKTLRALLDMDALEDERRQGTSLPEPRRTDIDDFPRRINKGKRVMGTEIHEDKIDSVRLLARKIGLELRQVDCMNSRRWELRPRTDDDEPSGILIASGSLPELERFLLKEQDDLVKATTKHATTMRELRARGFALGLEVRRESAGFKDDVNIQVLTLWKGAHLIFRVPDLKTMEVVLDGVEHGLYELLLLDEDERVAG